MGLIACGLTACSTPAPTKPTGPTEAEVKAAIQSTADCMQALGYQVGALTQLANGEWTFPITGVDMEDATQSAKQSKDYDACGAKVNLTELLLAHNSSNRLTGAERDEAMKQLLACLTEAGVQGLDANPKDSTVFITAIMKQLDGKQEAIGKAMACMDRHRSVWPPGDPNNP